MAADAALVSMIDACDALEAAFGPDSTATEAERAAAWAAHLSALSAVEHGGGGDSDDDAGVAARGSDGAAHQVAEAVSRGDVSAAAGLPPPRMQQGRHVAFATLHQLLTAPPQAPAAK